MSLVLVADDEPAVLEVLSEVVEDLGHDVLRASNGREALALARQQPPHLVVTDHMMPQLTGVELCRRLREDERLRVVPVILLSAALPQGVPEAQAYLPKPFELSDFEQLVQQTLQQRGELTPGSTAVAIPDVDHLVHSVAHEIKTPLAAARLNLELLERAIGAGLEGADRAHLAALAGQLAALEAMVHGLVSASSLADGAVELARTREPLGALLEREIEAWSRRHPEVEVRVDRPGNEVFAEVDRRRIAELLQTLLTGAVRFGAPQRRVTVALLAGAGSATIRVADEGAAVGSSMNEGGAPSAPAQSHGVALYVASQIARLHGGALSVRSSHGEGAVFSLRLPTARQGARSH